MSDPIIMNDLILADSKSIKVRLALSAIVLLMLAVSVMAIKWQIGDLLADVTPSTDPNAFAIAKTALILAPSDPKGLSLKAASDGDAAAGIRSLEQAVRSAPFDYRWRVELGRALEQDEQFDLAETQFKKAVQLAPLYAQPRWYLGNFYLRQDRVDAALAELKLAAENNEIYRDQVFSLAWDYFEKDPAQIEKLAGDKPIAIARLAVFFAARGYAADSLRNWDRLRKDEKSNYLNEATALATGLFEQRHFTEALEFTHDLGTAMDAKQETVTNSSFENNLNGNLRFEWQIDHSDPKFGITTDSKIKHDGNRSLKATFLSYTKPAFVNILQTVVVRPGTKYRLTFWLRTENLKSAGPPVAEIINANDDTFIVRSQPFPPNTDDWQQIDLDFTAPANCDGITIRTGRSFCDEECPLTGTFWYDGFSLSTQ